MLYNRLDFLEFFDKEIIEDQEAGYFRYVSSSDDIALIVSMNIYENWVHFRIESKEKKGLIDFELDNINQIKCENKNGKIKFDFFQKTKRFPIVTAFIKPSISLNLNIVQKDMEELISILKG